MTLFISSVYIITAQEMKFSVKDLVTFTDEIRNGKLYFYVELIVPDIKLTLSGFWVILRLTEFSLK